VHKHDQGKVQGRRRWCVGKTLFVVRGPAPTPLTPNLPPFITAAFDDTFTLKDLEAGTAAQINKALASAPAHIRAMALQVIGVSDAAAKKSL
jgi:hypothetical protein